MTRVYPEGGRGWVVVFCSSVSMFITYGTLKSFGVLLTAISEDLNTDLWIVGSLTSLHLGLQFCIAPVVAAVARKVGFRPVIITGGILYGVGLALSSVSQNVWFLAVTMAVMTGIGGACVQDTLRAAYMMFFRERFSLANSLSAIGDPIGMIVYGPLTQVLLDTYGWRGVTLLLGGFSFHLVVCGLLAREPPAKYNDIPQNEEASNTDCISSTDNQQHTEKRCTWKTFGHSIVSLLGLEMFPNAEFIVLTCSRMLMLASYGSIVVYMIPNGLALGLSPSQASYLTTAWGVGGIAGPLLTSLLLHTKLVSVHAVSVHGLLIAACCTASPFVSSFSGQMVIANLISFAAGSIFHILIILTRNLPFDDNKLISVLCWQSCIAGGAIAICGVISGRLYDRTGSFHATFYWLGGLTLASFVCLLLHYVISKKR